MLKGGIHIPYWLSRRRVFESSLQSVNGFTGRGKVRVHCWNSGAQTLKVDLRGVAGERAEIVINGKPSNTVSLNNGKVVRHFNTAKGDSIEQAEAGAAIEIRQNDQPILQGALRPPENRVKTLAKLSNRLFRTA